jgi:hypothetical protein|tara:strand:- start:252 stop:863 length:612 start_codon:yes stop_codon:yes gene_type:complete
MYGGFDVYKTYLGVKLHFTSDTYDYYKYGGKVNTKLDTFTKRKDRYFFHKLSTRYAEADILDFFVANFLADSKRWIGNLLANDGRDVYLDYKKRKEAFAYHFKQDCGSIVSDFRRKSISFDDGFIPVNGQHPRVLRLLIQRKISYQTTIVLNHFLNFVKNWDKEITEKVVWPEISLKVTRLKPFINFNATECKLIMKEVFING